MKKRALSLLIFVLYSALLVKIMVFKNLPTITIGPLMFNFGGTDGNHPANFIPFTTILPYLLGDKGTIIAGANLIGNVVLLVPIGFLLPFMFRNVTWRKSLAAAFISGLTIEIMQSILRVGIFDIDDVLLNGLGVMLGYWAMRILTQWIRTKRYKPIIMTAVLIVFAATGVFYIVFPANAHKEGLLPRSGNLCGDTSGTGEIIKTENSMLTIRRNDGVVQTIKVIPLTTIKNSAGPISTADLKVGERVTLVVNDNDTASAVLVCSIRKNKTN